MITVHASNKVKTTCHAIGTVNRYILKSFLPEKAAKWKVPVGGQGDGLQGEDALGVVPLPEWPRHRRHGTSAVFIVVLRGRRELVEPLPDEILVDVGAGEVSGPRL